MESYKKIKTTLKIGYYQGLRVIKGLDANPWDAWYIINRDNRIVGVAGEFLSGPEFFTADDSEIRESKIAEIEIEIILGVEINLVNND